MDWPEKKHKVNGLTLVAQTFGVFTVLTFLLIVIDFVPETTSGQNTRDVVATASAKTVQSTDVFERTPESPNPVRIVIDEIGIDASITNPNSTDVDVLDRALLTGAVRYPGSGTLGSNANMLIFGHSSYLPVVRNKAYKAFNELGKLKPGSEITVFSDTFKYTYSVENVRMSAAEETLIGFESTEPMLTLATCNSFGTEQERWVVTAKLQSKEELE